MAILIYGESAIVTALDLDLSLHSMVRNVVLDAMRNPSGLFVAKTKLAINIEAPGINVTILCKTGGMTVSSSTTMDSLFLVSLIIKDLD